MKTFKKVALVFSLLCILQNGCQRNDKVFWYQEKISMLPSSASVNDVKYVLGTPQSTFGERESLLRIKQFNPSYSDETLKSLNIKSSIFYAIDPSNTLIVSFDNNSKMIKAFFGGQ